MHMLEHQQNLRDQESGIIRGKVEDFGYDVEQIFALNELHDKVYEIAVFDELVKTDNESVFGDCPKYLLLAHDVLDYL